MFKKLAIIILVLFCLVLVPCFSQGDEYWSHTPIPNSKWYSDPGIMDFGGRESYVYLPQEAEDKAGEKEQVKEAEQVKTWILPSYMLENLKFMQDEFTRKFEAKLNSYKSELISRFEEFKDMPEDVILIDLEKGIFIERDEYTRLLKEQQLKQQQALQAEAEKKKPEESKK